MAKRFVFIGLLAGLGFWISVSSVRAEAARYYFDPAKTTITIELVKLGLFDVRAKFAVFSGHFTFDEKDIPASAVELNIETGSIQAESDWETDRFRSSDYLNVMEYPTMTFTSVQVEKTSETTAILTGGLKMVGITRPLSLTLKFRGFTEDANGAGKTLAHFHAEGSLQRSDYGMTSDYLFLSDRVWLRLDITGVRE